MEENDVIESANNLEVADQEETVESTVESEVVENTEKIQEETTEQTSEETQAETKVPQSAEDNSKYRQARIKAEQEAKKKIEQARKEAYEQGLQQGKVQSYIGKQNPYTGKEIKDHYDVEEYLEMYELDSKGQDPIEGHRELQKQKARDEAEKKLKQDEENKQKQWYENDTKDFLEKYSSEKLQELTNDPDFDLFANGKIGKLPLAKIYEDYKRLISKYERKSVETAKQIVANNTATPGGIEETEAQELNWNSMSSEQFEKYVQRAKNGELK